jgi:putative spermidine/putrescine transport system ATP-binding protein
VADVQIIGLRKTFGPTVAVDDFTLSVADGEFVALLGPSGCGKTTVMRMIAGITEADQGQVILAGQRIDALVPERRTIGLVFQSYALFPHMSVARNVAFGLRMRGQPAGQIAAKVAQTLAMVDLSGQADRLPRELSGGQQQRVALARAIAIEPPLLLLDEPLSNLDAKLREHLRDDLKALQRRLGITTIHVTHDQSEAMALADRVVVMNAGAIVEIGSPRDLYQTPKTRFTAEFLGHTNIIPARVQSGRMMTDWGQMVGAAPSGAGSVQLSVRPEDLGLTQSDQGAGQVTDVTFLGAEVEHRLAIGGLTLRSRSSGRDAAVHAVGTKVALTFPADLHLLSQDPAP